MGWIATPYCSSLATSFQKLRNSKRAFQERQDNLCWRNEKPFSWKEHRRSRNSWSATKKDMKWPTSPLSGKKMCHLCSPLQKKQSGSPWNEKLKIHTLQLVTSDYVEVKISAESRRVSKFIKTIRISILTSDKFIYKLLFDRNSHASGHPAVSGCQVGGKSPRGTLDHMPSLAVCTFSKVLACSCCQNQISKWNELEVWSRMAVLMSPITIAACESKRHVCLLLEEGKARKQESVRQMPCYHWY